MDIEQHLDKHLETYLKEGRKDSANGVSHVQRICRIGYNQACNMIERGIEKGILISDNDAEYLHRIAL